RRAYSDPGQQDGDIRSRQSLRNPGGLSTHDKGRAGRCRLYRQQSLSPSVRELNLLAWGRQPIGFRCPQSGEGLYGCTYDQAIRWAEPGPQGQRRENDQGRVLAGRLMSRAARRPWFSLNGTASIRIRKEALLH